MRWWYRSRPFPGSRGNGETLRLRSGQAMGTHIVDMELKKNSRFLRYAVAGAPASVGMTRVCSGAKPWAAGGIGSPSLQRLSTVPPSPCYSFSFAPSGARSFSISPPTACAVGCILSPLRGWQKLPGVRTAGSSTAPSLALRLRSE